MKKIIPALFIMLLSSSPLAWAEAPKTPVQIEADEMLSSQKDNSVFFSGKVEAKQEDLTIHSDEMTVYYVGTPATGKPGKDTTAAQGASSDGPTPLEGGVKRMLAVGHVEITKEGWVATGNQAEYFSEERKVVLTGDTKVWQGNNLVTGDSFTMYLDEGKSIVERTSKKGERVKAFFYPDAKK